MITLLLSEFDLVLELATSDCYQTEKAYRAVGLIAKNVSGSAAGRASICELIAKCEEGAELAAVERRAV
ncbi:hypothetical protein, partial [Pseudomonas savastanoi]